MLPNLDVPETSPRSSRRRRNLIAAAVVAVLAITGTVVAITVSRDSRSGALGPCTIGPNAQCPGADLTRANLQFMNLSGAALRPYLKRDGWNAADDLMVIVDEVAVPAGEYRLRAAGSPGGHNGLKSIEAHLKSPTYPRLRIGIKPVDERRQIGDLADFVLHAMPRDERELVEALYPRMITALELWIADGTEKAVSAMGR